MVPPEVQGDAFSEIDYMNNIQNQIPGNIAGDFSCS